MEDSKIHTLIITRSEQNGSSFIANKALSDPRLSKVLRHRSTLLQDGVGANNLDDECVTIGAGFELFDLNEDWLPQARSSRCIALLQLLRCRSRH